MTPRSRHAWILEREQGELHFHRLLAQDFRAFDFMSPWEGAEYILPGDEKVEGEAPGAPTPAAAGAKPSEAQKDAVKPDEAKK